MVSKNVAKHTPGPWEVEGPPENDSACYHEGNRFAIVSECYDPDDVDHEEPMYPTIAEVWPTEGNADRADAYLIAAAPELYAALEAILSQHDAGYQPSAGHYDMARAALAKAEALDAALTMDPCGDRACDECDVGGCEGA